MLRRFSVLGGTALLAGGLAMSGCAAVHNADKAVKAGHAIEKSVKGNQATIDSFTTSMKSSQNTPFEATYKTSGSSPATVVYAVKPPNEVSFSTTPTGSGSAGDHVSIIGNAHGEFFCSTPSSGPPQCEKSASLGATAESRCWTSTRRRTG